MLLYPFCHAGKQW